MHRFAWYTDLLGADGRLFPDPDHAAEALTFLRGLIEAGISPRWVTAADEELSRRVFGDGHAIFLRNSMTVIMKVDLVGSRRRSLALGFNEFAGYLAVGITSWATGYIAAQTALRPQPFYLGIGIAVTGLALSVFFVRETRGYTAIEAAATHQAAPACAPSLRRIFYATSLGNVSLFARLPGQARQQSQRNDGMSWGIYPLFFAAHGLDVARIGVVKAVYPGVWGVLQILTRPLSDRVGRKALIAAGMVVQAAGIWLTVLVADYGA